jgi:hypothetical protein
MKKFMLFFLIIGLVFSLAACNTPTDDDTSGGGAGAGGGGGGGGGGGDGGGGGVIDPGDYVYVLGNSDNYPGAEVDLSEYNLLDISKYANVTVNATLYTDTEGKTKATVPTGDNKNLAQFSLLKVGASGWDDSSKCGPTKYNMVIDGDTTWNVSGNASGVPAKLLLQANWADFTGDGVKVKSIKVNKITFTPKTDDPIPVLDVVYGDSYVSVAGNKITFNNAMYSDGAALFVFPDNFPTTLTGKRLVIGFTIENHDSHLVPTTTSNNSPTTTATAAEHQIHIQAANSDKNGFNGQNPDSSNGNVGQKYITLDDSAAPPKGTGWDGTRGTISVPLNDLLAAAAVNIDNGKDCKAPFTLDAIRIVNNGTMWKENEGKANEVIHIRCKSYTLVIESVKVE